jgi:hypothetical protein
VRPPPIFKNMKPHAIGAQAQALLNDSEETVQEITTGNYQVSGPFFILAGKATMKSGIDTIASWADGTSVWRYFNTRSNSSYQIHVNGLSYIATQNPITKLNQVTGSSFAQQPSWMSGASFSVLSGGETNDMSQSASYPTSTIKQSTLGTAWYDRGAQQGQTLKYTGFTPCESDIVFDVASVLYLNTFSPGGSALPLWNALNTTVGNANQYNMYTASGSGIPFNGSAAFNHNLIGSGLGTGMVAWYPVIMLTTGISFSTTDLTSIDPAANDANIIAALTFGPIFSSIIEPVFSNMWFIINVPAWAASPSGTYPEGADTVSFGFFSQVASAGYTGTWAGVLYYNLEPVYELSRHSQKYVGTAPRTT